MSQKYGPVMTRFVPGLKLCFRFDVGHMTSQLIGGSGQLFGRVMYDLASGTKRIAATQFGGVVRRHIKYKVLIFKCC